MSKRFYLKHKTTGCRYDIIALDKVTGIVTLRGPNGGEWQETYDLTNWRAQGYTLLSYNENVKEGANAG